MLAARFLKRPPVLASHLAIVLAVFTVFFGLMARVPQEGVPYPPFFLAALVVWHVAAKVLGEGSNSVVTNSALVNRVYFPRIYFPVSVALATLADLALNLLAFAVVLALFGIVPGWPSRDRREHRLRNIAT